MFAFSSSWSLHSCYFLLDNCIRWLSGQLKCFKELTYILKMFLQHHLLSHQFSVVAHTPHGSVNLHRGFLTTQNIEPSINSDSSD